MVCFQYAYYSIKWSKGYERIYLAIPNESNPQIIELVSPETTVESNILTFEGEVAEGLLAAGEYEVWYLGNSKESGNSYITEEIEDEVIKSISGSIASQSGDLNDLGYCHIAMTTVTAKTEGEDVVLSLNGTLKNKIAIAHLDLEGITNLKGDAIVGTEYALQYNNGAFEFAVTPDAKANIAITEGTTASYVVLFPNATANIDLKSNTSKKVTFKGGVEANKIYYKHVSDMEYYPLTWEDYEEENTINGHEYVDLGLPSGLLWATCNVGANSPEEYGDYFAWGETETKSDYTNCPAVLLSYSELQSQGYIDEDGKLTPSHDAAAANWGGSWRMPTFDELHELRTSCTWTWTTQNGVNGYKLTSKTNGNTIFLPAAGCYRRGYKEGTRDYGYYWGSEPSGGNTEHAYAGWFYSSGLNVIQNSRSDCLPVRSVSGGNFEDLEKEDTPSGEINGHEYVDLGLPSGLKWATCNIGAEMPEEYGDYYSWGEINEYDKYLHPNIPTGKLSYSELQSQGYIDENGNLTPSHDAATANWGNLWRMPIKDEMQELLSNCNWKFTTQNNVNGFKVTGPNGKHIFLPAAGTLSGSSIFNGGSDGKYWSSTPYSNSNSTYILYFYYSGSSGYSRYINGTSRGYGLSIRPVID